MKHRIIVSCLCILFGFPGATQNLVPNGSFEEYTQCPDQWQQIHLATPWLQPNVNGGPGGSSEFYHRCSMVIFTSVPANYSGWQEPQQGDGYAGIGTFGGSVGSNSRENIQVKLYEPLIKDSLYYLNFYTCKSESFFWACDALGAYISVNRPTTTDWKIIPGVTPQVTNPPGQILYDTMNWVKIEGTFTAKGGEEWLTIGNLTDDSLIHLDSVNYGNLWGAYYLIDNVSLMLLSDTGRQDSVLPPPPEPGTEALFLFPNAFSPNGDGYNEEFLPITQDIENFRMTIYNRYGEPVFETADPAMGWNGTRSGEPQPIGVYTYISEATDPQGNTLRRTGNVQLLR